MGKLFSHGLWLLSLTISFPAAATSETMLVAKGVPAGFDELASARVTMVDVYFGGRKVGEALAEIEPGALKFRSPSELLSRIPDVTSSPSLLAALHAKLPTNSGAVCSAGSAGDCGVLEPEVVGIIYDESRFRVELFINPALLRSPRSGAPVYLPVPDGPLSLTNSFGFNASGALNGVSVYNVQNRTVIGLRNARLRANTSVASRLGLVVDDLVGEADRGGLRYSAGLFWAPGNEFTGQRRIIGAGVGTQFDTSLDRDSLRGTPLVLFLAQPARVELLVDGRLVSSRSYPGGNIDLDTSALSDGSYTVLIRVHQPNGSIREERRFFVKNAQIAPMGRPLFYAYAGLLANTRAHRPISPSRTFYYQAGAAKRLTNNVALDFAVSGTQHKALIQAGGWLIAGPARLRAAGMVSTSGDTGALIQGTSASDGPLSISFDLRRIWSRNGASLIPLASHVSSFGGPPPSGVQLATGSYTQATGSVGVRLGTGYLSLVGSYRRDRHAAPDYSVGPSLSLPVFRRNGMQAVFEASAQRTRTNLSGFAGMRLLMSSGRMSMLSTAGRGFEKDYGGNRSSVSRAVGNFTGQYSHENQDEMRFNVSAGAERTTSASTGFAAATVDSRLGNVRADITHGFEGRGGTQYNLSVQSGLAFSGDSVALGARDMEQSAIMVSLSGDAPGAAFNLLVDDVVRGRVKVGQRLTLFVPGYRRYKVRIVPADALPIRYDGAAREVTLYPGNVRSLAWRAEIFFTVFGRAVGSNGLPLGNALLEAGREVTQADSQGYFQIDARRGDRLAIASDGGQCRLDLAAVAVRNDLASVGTVVCQ